MVGVDNKGKTRERKGVHSECLLGYGKTQRHIDRRGPG